MSRPLADLDAFEQRCPQPLTDADRPRAAALIDDASDLARAAFNTTWLDEDGAVVNPTVTRIVINAAMRAFLNPGGFLTEATGDWTGSRRREDAQVGVFFTDEEKGQLAALIETPSGLWSLPVGRGRLETRPVCDPCDDVPWVE